MARIVLAQPAAGETDLVRSSRAGSRRHHVPDCGKIAGHGGVNLRQNTFAKLGRQGVNLLACDAQILRRAGCQSPVDRIAAGRVHSVTTRQHLLQTGEKTQIDGIGHGAHISVLVAAADVGAIP